MSNRGRPTEFRPEYCEQVEKLCRLGATNPDIADFFGVARSTIDLWMVKHPEFSGAVKKGRIVADMEVANSLYRKATGFHYQSEVATKDGPVELTMFAQPDTTAAIFWLKNRRREHWSDTRREEISGPDGRTIELVIVDPSPRPASLPAPVKAGKV